MTEPTPLRFTIEVELRATPEQVWAAIATSNGISAWMMPTDLDERVGGAVVFHMGDIDSKGTVTGWDPPRRIEYEEPDWAALAGHGDADVNPLVTEFLVEARSGGTCVVRVTSSAFSTGADWENEFFVDMAKGWAPCFDVLRLYVEEFAAEPATGFELMVPSGVDKDGLRAAFDRGGDLGTIETTGDDHMIIRLDGPTPGFVMLWAMAAEDGTSLTRTNAYLYGDASATAIDGVRSRVQAWLDEVAPS
jgi:uncharacterized protein YndB with AHSA1/START domain